MIIESIVEMIRKKYNFATTFFESLTSDIRHGNSSHFG